MSLQELSRALEDRTLWTSVIHRASKSQSQLNSVKHTKYGMLRIIAILAILSFSPIYAP